MAHGKTLRPNEAFVWWNGLGWRYVFVDADGVAKSGPLSALTKRTEYNLSKLVRELKEKHQSVTLVRIQSPYTKAILHTEECK